MNNSLEKSESKVTVKPKAGDIYIDSRESAIRLIGNKDKRDHFHYEWLADVLNGTWELSERTIDQRSLEEFYTKISQEEFDKGIIQAKAFLETGELIGFDDPQGGMNEETALIGGNSKEALLGIQGNLEEKKNQLDGMQRILDLRMAEQKNKMQQMKRQIEEKLTIFKKEITKMVRIITMIELYLGIDEEIHQIQEGPTADINEPITFRQQILYMDEETAILDDGGLDFSKVEVFDAWLLKNQNYKKLIPEIKGIICLKPRRFSKDYGDGDYYKTEKNIKNRDDSYFLIRNGESIFRIFTEKIVVPNRLFPKRSEFKELLEKVKNAYEGSSDKERAEEHVEKLTFYYRKLAFFYQGLIDRTNVFHPMKQAISVFKMEDCEDAFNFIYDDEMLLPTGKLPFWDWHNKINRMISRGNRVLIANVSRNRHGGYEGFKSFDDRVSYQYRNTDSLPANGIYEIESRFESQTQNLPHYYVDQLEKKGLLISKSEKMCDKDESVSKGYETYDTHPKPEEGQTVIYHGKAEKGSIFGPDHGIYIECYKCTYKKEIFSIKYNPGGTIWTEYGHHERKHRISFDVFPYDDFLFNYEQIDTESIEFYLNSRADRPNYYRMIPLLKELLSRRQEEHKWEKSFVQMVVDNAKRKLGVINEKMCEKFVWECIEWWKRKVITKRPITKDDTLALRMIEKRVLADSNRKFISDQL